MVGQVLDTAGGHRAAETNCSTDGKSTKLNLVLSNEQIHLRLDCTYLQICKFIYSFLYSDNSVQFLFNNMNININYSGDGQRVGIWLLWIIASAIYFCTQTQPFHTYIQQATEVKIPAYNQHPGPCCHPFILFAFLIESDHCSKSIVYFSTLII